MSRLLGGLHAALGRSQTAVWLMGRVTCGNEEDLVEPERLACLARNGQVTIVHRIEAAAEEAETKGARLLSAGCRGLRFRIW